MVRQIVLTSSIVLACLGAVRADDGLTLGKQAPEWNSLPLTKNSGSSPEVLYNRHTQAQRLRQQRALYQEQQRLARIEANQWMGYEPLRPTWPANPSMTSRYPANRVVVIPYFVP